MSLLDSLVGHWLIFVFVNGLVVTASYCLASRWLKHATFSADFSVVLLSAGLLYLSIIIVLVLFFGVAVRTLDVLSVGLASVFLSSAIIVTQWRYRLPFCQAVKHSWQRLRHSRDGWLWLFLVLLLAQLLFTLIKVYIVPVHVVDSMAYRALPAPMWYQLGHIPAVLDVPANEVNGRSLSIAVLMLWYFLFSGSDQLVNLPQYISSLILVLLSYAMARQCSISRRTAFKVSVLVYFMPVVLLQSITTQDHLSINVAFLASLYFLRAGFMHKTLRFMPLLGVSVGLMFAFKNNAVIYMPVLGFAGLWLMLVFRRTVRWEKSVLQRFVLHAFLACVLAILVGGYWTVKNMVVHGNPFGLLFVPSVSMGKNVAQTLTDFDENEPRVGKSVSASVKKQKEDRKDHRALDASDQLTGIAVSFMLKAQDNLLHNAENFFFRVSDSAQILYEPTLKKISGFGPQFFSIGLFSLMLFISVGLSRSFENKAGFYAGMGMLMLLTYFCIMVNVYAYRNFIFFPILLLPYAFYWMEQKGYLVPGTWPGRGMHTVMLICVVWCAFLDLLPASVNPLLLKEYAAIEPHYQSPARYMRQISKVDQVMRRQDELPVTAGFAYVNSMQRNVWSYAYFDVHWRRPVTYIPLYAKYFDCDTARLICKPSEAFKKRLHNDEIAFVNLCFYEYCLALSDPDFYELGRGFYYFRGWQ